MKTEVTVKAGPTVEATWRDVYPALLDCLTSGRKPSSREVQIVAERMSNDIEGPVADPAQMSRIVGAARVALEGDKCAHCRRATLHGVRRH